jgi:hypothetical protein
MSGIRGEEDEHPARRSAGAWIPWLALGVERAMGRNRDLHNNIIVTMIRIINTWW